MSDEINRHKSTRWVQNQAASYGDEWGNEDDYEEEYVPDESESVSNTLQNTSVHSDTGSVLQSLSPKLNKGVHELNILEGDQSNEKTTGGNKRLSRFFITNPDLSNTESEAEEVSASLEHEDDLSPERNNVNDSKVEAQTTEEKDEGSVAHDEANVEENHNDLSSDVSSEEIEPTPPLKVHSRASSRNVSVNLDEDSVDHSAARKKEKLKSKDYSNIDFVMDDYLTKRDSQFYDEKDVQHEKSNMEDLHERVDEETDNEDEAEDGEDHYRFEESGSFEDDHSDKLDHDHSLIPTADREEESATNNLSVTPNEYSLARSLSSGSLSTGSWSVRSSAQFVNGLSSARDSFIGKLKTERGRSNSGNSNSGDHRNEEEEEEEEEEKMNEHGKNSPYLDSSSDDDDDSIRVTPGQSINFGHWRPNTSNFRNAFVKETNFNDNDSVLPSINNENEEYDDSYSVMTSESSLIYPNEEGHFFTKPLEDTSGDDESYLERGEHPTEDNSKISHDMVSTMEISPPIGFEEQFKSSAERGGKFSDEDEDADSNATETEKFDDEEDEGTDIDESYSGSLNNTSISVAENDSSGAGTPIKQKYSSLLSGLIETPRLTSLSSSVEPGSRVASDVGRSKISREVSGSSNHSSQQTTIANSATTLKQFTPFDFKQIQKLTNPENRLTELRKWSKEESELDTGLQEWLTTELTKVSSGQDGYDSLGPITLNAYKQLTATTHLHGHSVTDMITRKHSINFGSVVGHSRLKLKNRVGDHGGNLAKGIFNRGKKIMRNSSNGGVAE